jgi:hypothetical protein
MLGYYLFSLFVSLLLTPPTRTHSAYLPNYNVDQMLENCRMMDINKDSLVDLNEFLEAFRLSQQSANQPSVIRRNSNLIETTVTVDEPPKEKEDTAKGDVQVDEYEISEMKEIAAKGGKMISASPSIRSVVSMESLGHTAGQNGAVTGGNHAESRLPNDGDIEIDDIVSRIDAK